MSAAGAAWRLNVAVAEPRVPLLHVADLSALGVPTRVESNDAGVIAIARESFAQAPPSRATFALRVRLEVTDDAELPLRDARGQFLVQHRAESEGRLVIESGASVAMSDPCSGEAYGRVARALVADREHFRASVLEALVYAMMSARDRHPLHAAGLVRDGRALLLAGRSGAGKSTLSYVARRAGVTVLSDDHVWVQLQPMLAVWGRARAIRLLPPAREAFPELSASGTAWAGGKEKVHVPLEEEVPDAPLHDVRVCVLDRGGVARVHRISAGEVTDALTRQVDAGFDRYPTQHARVATALARRGGWRLYLSGDAHDALPLLSRMLDD